MRFFQNKTSPDNMNWTSNRFKRSHMPVIKNAQVPEIFLEYHMRVQKVLLKKYEESHRKLHWKVFTSTETGDSKEGPLP